MQKSQHKGINNPFVHDTATNLSPDQILNYYIQDYTYSRFLESPMNVFLLGERGSGKTMALRYHSYEVQKRQSEIDEIDFDLSTVGIYVSCNSTFFMKREYDLIENNKFKIAAISEGFLVMALGTFFANVMTKISLPDPVEKHKQLIEDFEYLLGEKLPDKDNFFESILLFVNRQNRELQDRLNNSEYDVPPLKAFNFYTFIKPLINFTRRFDSLKDTHFLFLIDDVQDLHYDQIKLLNSWIAYRDHSEFSFKLSSTKATDTILLTSSGGTILEGHDFMTIDMEEPKQNSNSDYGKLIRRIVAKRLEIYGIVRTPEEFFPENSEFIKDIEQYKSLARAKAIEKYGDTKESTKQITDYVYKYARAEYFRNRAKKSNRPPYSGLETIIHLSTGVVRNFLYPCFYMYDTKVSEDTDMPPQYISPKIQDDIIKEKSQELWNLIPALANTVTDCSTIQAEHINNLFINLVLLIKERLKLDISEPRAISFTISGYTDDAKTELEPLLKIARKARLLYVRYGSAKDDGLRESYYTPNRLLLPAYGLDVVGQHSRISLAAKDLIAAAKNNKKFSFKKLSNQPKSLFDGQD